jgi:hypothetical protein
MSPGPSEQRKHIPVDQHGLSPAGCAHPTRVGAKEEYINVHLSTGNL